MAAATAGLLALYFLGMPAARSVAGGNTTTTITATVSLVAYEVSASNIGYYSATISWKTNGNATSQVFYDTVSHDNITGYAYHTTEAPSLVSEHSIALTRLSSSMTYHYRVRSVIPDTEFIAISGDYTFTTLSPPVGWFPPPPPPPVVTTISLTGLEAPTPLQVDAQGIVQASTQLTTADGKVSLNIAQGTKLLDAQGNRLASLSAAPEPSPPAPPVGAVVILAYSFGPDGASFNPPITLTIQYDPAALPKGFAEQDLYIAYWDGSKWLALETTVNAEANTASCKLGHFTTFAVIAPPVPPAPAAFSLSNLTVQPTQVQPTQAATITVSVANTGGKEGSYTVVLKINGVKEAEKSVTVAAGKRQDVSFSVSRKKPGSYTVNVDGLSGSFSVAPVPGAFLVTNLSITPLEVQPNEIVTITVSVTNTYDRREIYSLVLKINGVKEAEKQAELDAGSSQDVSFSVTRGAPGSYTVFINGLSGSFTVAEVPPVKPLINWPLIGGIIAAVVVVGLVVFFLVRRRRA